MNDTYVNLGICSIVDWQEIIKEIKDIPGDQKNLRFFEMLSSKNQYKYIFNQLKDANFNLNSIEWINYYPGIHYQSSVDEVVKTWLDLKGIHRAWISRVNPGFYAPWHWDVDDQEKEYLKKGSIKRYSGFLDHQLNNIAHAFVIENDYVVNTKQGEFIYWKNHRSWHAGMNAGISPKFMYHILGW